jgi:hypothetical protein
MSKAKLRKVKETIRDEEGFPMRIDGLQKLESEITLMRHIFHRNVSILFEVNHSILSIHPSDALEGD